MADTTSITSPLLLDETGRAIVEALTQKDMTGERIREINTAAEAAKESIEAKTNEQLEKIPEVTELADDLNRAESQLSESIADLKSDLDVSIAGLSNTDYIPSVKWEMGYIEPTGGTNHAGPANSRMSEMIHVRSGDKLVKDQDCTLFAYYYDAKGSFLSYENIAGQFNNDELAFTSEKYLRLTFAYRPLATIDDPDVANDYLHFVLLYHYKRVDDLESGMVELVDIPRRMDAAENVLIKANYAKSEIVKGKIASTTYEVSLKQGHKYRAFFQSSSALNQVSFYLQIYEGQSVTSALLKNFGDVWKTQNTETGLEYVFTADKDYHGYFRFGYAMNTVPTDVMVNQEIYDLTEPIYIEVDKRLNDLEAFAATTETQIDNLKDGLENTATHEYVDNATKAIEKSYWAGKKIVWFGTSIPAGVVNAGDEGGNGAYPTRIGQLLGATVYNEAVGSSAARIGMHGAITEADPNGYAGVPATCCLLSLSGTVAEKQDIIDRWDIWKNVFTIGVNGVDTTNPEKYLNCSYERKLAKYLTGGTVGPVDLYVFDHGYNDGGNGNGGNYTDTTDIPSNPYDRTYFIGAMNYLIDQIKKDNYMASIAIISHYNDEGAFANLVEAQKYIAEKWNIPFINISNKMGFSTTMSVTINGVTKTMKDWWLPDGIHPAADKTGKALQHYAEALYPLIRDLR